MCRALKSRQNTFLFSIACPYMIQKPTSAHASIGSQATFECDGIAVPNFTISWNFGGKEIKATKKYSLANGNRQLTINGVQANDAGKYTCVVRSPFGQQSAVAQLDVGGAAGTPAGRFKCLSFALSDMTVEFLRRHSQICQNATSCVKQYFYL